MVFGTRGRGSATATTGAGARMRCIRDAGETWSNGAYMSGERTHLACWRWRPRPRSEEHTSELQSQSNLVCRLLLEKKKKKQKQVKKQMIKTYDDARLKQH